MSKNILVTGGTEGFGRQIAETFHQNDWDVAILGRNRDKTAKVAEEIGVEHVVADITDPEAVQKSALQVAEFMGSLAVLVNNAGVQTKGDFFDMDPDDVQQMVAVNLLGPMNVTQTYGELLEDDARIFNIGSYAGKNPAEKAPVYSAAKAGLAAFSEAIGKDFRRKGISTTLVTPAALEVDTVDSEGVKAAQAGGLSYKDAAETLWFYANGPRNASPEEIVLHGLDRWARRD